MSVDIVDIKAKRPVYLCAFSDPKCRWNVNCMKHGGYCFKTTDSRYAELDATGVPIICEYDDFDIVVKTEESEE